MTIDNATDEKLLCSYGIRYPGDRQHEILSREFTVPDVGVIYTDKEHHILSGNMPVYQKRGEAKSSTC